ncbi:MAG: phosphoglycerate kinase [Maricaulaceae bacterium]
MDVGFRLNRLEDAAIAGQRALVRVDFNVPMVEHETGRRITDDTRLRAALPTIRHLRERGCKIVLCAHYGRPKGQAVDAMSLRPVADALAGLLGERVKFINDCVGPLAQGAAADLEPGCVLLLENTRFHEGEEANAPAFAQDLAALADIYVNDAFSAAHRAHASAEGVARYLPAYAGLALGRELDYLAQALEAPARPSLAVVGGAKVSTKLDLLANLVKKVDMLFVGGGMANTFLFAQGHDLGLSLCEKDLAETARAVMAGAAQAGCTLILPTDLVCTQTFEAHAPSQVRAIDSIGPDDMAVDVGPDTVDRLADAIDQARTLVWNGPLGAFELKPFDTGTVEAARYAAKRVREAGLIAVPGRRDTVAALNAAQIADDFTYVSTAGGAFLEWLEGKTLPGIAALASA